MESDLLVSSAAKLSALNAGNCKGESLAWRRPRWAGGSSKQLCHHICGMFRLETTCWFLQPQESSRRCQISFP